MKAAHSISLPAKIRRRAAKIYLFGEAVGWLAWAGILIRCLPFKRLTGYLTPPVSSVSKANDKVSEQVRWAVKAAAKRVFWRAVCFHQGIAAQRMLCRRGIRAELCYGVRHKPGVETGMEAHVWVVAEDRIVVGGETADAFSEIARFSPQ